MKEYVKPEIKFKSVEVSENIANTCWGEVAGGKDGNVYYHMNGKQYKLILSGNSCKDATLESIWDSNGTAVETDDTMINEDTPIYEAISSIFSKVNNSTNTFEGSFSDNFS